MRPKIRVLLLRFMYAYTVVGAGAFGLGILIFPDLVRAYTGWPVNEPVTFGMVGSMMMAFAVVALLGFGSPMKFTPVLLLQMSYKLIWLVAIILPLIITGRFPRYAGLIAFIYLTYIVGDYFAIPFSELFSIEDKPKNNLDRA